MSVAKKEEVCSHPLGLRLGEPAVGVPIKKRPVLLCDKSVPSGMPLSIKPSSTVTGMSVSTTGAGCIKESLLNRSKSDTNVIPKCNGIANSRDQNHANISFTPSAANSRDQNHANRSFTPSAANSRDQNHANRSFTPSVTEKNGVLATGSSEIRSCGESGRGIVAPIVKSQSQKFLTLDLQLASCQNAKINYSSLVKKEKLDQGLSAFPSAELPKDVQITSVVKSPSNSSLGKLPILDLNVPLDPVDHLEGFPTMHEGCNRLHHSKFQHQKARGPLVAPISTISSGPSLNIDGTLNLSNTYGLSNKRGAADITLDLQLKPPTRPELGINWKGLTPDPELSLSLFGNHTDEPKDLSVPDAIFKSEPVGSAKKISGEFATPMSDKSPVEKILKPVPRNANSHTIMPSTVSVNVEMVSSSSVKKEPEEPSRQHIQNNVEKAPLFEHQSVELISNCAEFEKTDNTNQVLGKAGFDLKSENFPNNSVHNGLETMTDSVPVQMDRLGDVVCTETMPVVSDVEKFVKHEEITTDIPSPVIATVSGQSAPLIAKSLPLEGNVASPAVGLCESASQSIIYTSEPACCNPVEASTDYKSTFSHVHAHEDVTCKPCDDKEACDVSPSSSNPTAESLVFNSRDRAAFDGMSQGSASMDCSDDGANAISQLPTTNKPHVESLGNSQITEANNLSTELRKEHDSDMHHDCSSVTNKVHMQGIDDDKRANTKDGIATHSGEEHQSEVSVNGIFEDKQLLTSDKNSPVNNTEVQDVKTATGASSTDLRRSSALGTSASPKVDSTRQSHKTLDNCLEKSRIPVIKSERSQSPDGKQAANCSQGNAKIAAVKSEHGTENEEIVKVSNLHPRDSVLGEDSHLDGASSSQPHNECTKVKSTCERSEHEKSKPDSCMTSSVQNEKVGQVDGTHWRDVENAYVNRNERWERFMESEREKNKGEYLGDRHASDMMNQRRTDHRYGGRGAGYHGHLRNFRGPRMSNESEFDFADEPIVGRRRPFEDDLAHFHRIPHRRRRSPPVNNQMPGCLMRDMDHDRFSGREIPDPRLLAHGQMEDLPDEMMEERFFMSHSHPRHALGDHTFIHRERSHSPGQRRGVPMHFHQGRSPEAMHRSPPLNRTDRPYLPHQRHTRQRGSPFDRIGHDERGMPRNMRRCGMHQAVEGDSFEPPLHPAQLAELHAEAELTERRKFGERRAYLRSLEESPVGDEEEMLSYHGEGDMDFAEGDGGPREPDGCFRNRLEHRARGEQEDGYRYRGPQGCRDGNSNDNIPKRRRY